MFDISQAALWVTHVALGMSVLSFVMFLVSAGVTIRTQWAASSVTATANQVTNAVARSFAAVEPATPNTSVADLQKLLSTTKEILDLVVKAGPGLASLVASIFFLIVSAWAAGAKLV